MTTDGHTDLCTPWTVPQLDNTKTNKSIEQDWVHDLKNKNKPTHLAV